MATKKDIPTWDENGELVHRFALTMNNLGLAKAGHELETMLASDRWQHFMSGHIEYRFLPGEFDYFLTAHGVTREQVMDLRDVELKAKLEEAMDDRRTGEDGYRRRITDIRAQVPVTPYPVEPFGYTQKEAKALVVDGAVLHSTKGRAALGDSVRRYRATNGQTTRAPSRTKPRWEQVARTVANLDDEDFMLAYEAIKIEAAKRRKDAH